ncbi:MAG: flagellar basal body P-ring protein FlgI [Planctomycetaceae bacterium]|nr:flagellar basal body P-ring protein FlgI [Planctomycetaceae bacterium]MCA9066041.1 flagellar basal body P-ring protein FlgI [Planctomycetaceae bacterium]
MFFRHAVTLFATFLIAVSGAGGTGTAMGTDAPPVRIKDITTVSGEHSNHLVGYGLVTGLAGTGGTNVSTKRLALLLQQQLEMRSDPTSREQIQRLQDKTDNISAVIVTAELPPHAKPNQKIDVLVSTMDNAKSLAGGVLIQTVLSGVDGEVYAIAQGPISLNGGDFGGQAASVTKNHPVTGRVANGATIEAAVPTTIVQGGKVRLLLNQPEYETAERIADAINLQFPETAVTEDPSTVALRVPTELLENPHRFVTACQSLSVVPDTVARVVINERTGTIVVGNSVRLSQVAITHGNLVVTTAESPQVSQPGPLSGGQTAVVPRTDVTVTEQQSVMNVLEQTMTVGDLAASLNSLGVSPRDLSSIFQMLKESGALHGELIIR